jgi:pimeloyl-ACP methyl ester carboxylesterase
MPLWFGPQDRPLWGWLHAPEDGRIRGGVVLAPTMGIESVSAHHAFRRLGDRLAQAGFVALRFDYDGMGDSAGRTDDPGRAAAWLGSVRAAVDFVRALGADRVGVVGMRIGATLCAEAFGSGPALIDDLVLWDPCASGRNFLREQSVLWSVALGVRANDDGSIETPGLVYEKDTVAELSAMVIADRDGPLADGVLLLMRASRNGDRKMNARLDLPHVERVAITGQEDLVDVLPHEATVPEETIGTIVDWMVSRAGAPTSTLQADEVAREIAVVAMAPDGVPIEEKPVSLSAAGLFGITTSRRDAGAVTPKDRPTIFLFNAGEIGHVGPARLWVDLARRWAESGFRVIRFDLIGIGDSPVPPGQPPHVVYRADALDEILHVLQDVLPDDPSNAVLIGLCSGAYHAVEGAIAGKVRGLCAVNPILTFKPPEVSTKAPPELHVGLLDDRRQASGAIKGWARALPAHGRLGPFVEGLPGPAWWVINRIAVESPPARSFSKLVDAGVNVYVLAGDVEAHLLCRGEGRTIRRLTQRGGLQMEVIPDLEHSLFERYGRLRAVELLTDHLLHHYGTTSDR